MIRSLIAVFMHELKTKLCLKWHYKKNECADEFSHKIMSKSYYFPKQQLYNRFHSNLKNDCVIFQVFMNTVALNH